MVGTRQGIAVSHGAGFSGDCQRGRLAAQQSFDPSAGGFARVDGYFRRSGHGALTRKKRATDRIPRISLEAERFEPLSAGHFERSDTTRGAAFPANQHEWAKGLRPVSRGRNYLRLARARYHARCASATLQFIYGCVFFRGRIFPSDRFVAQRGSSSPAIRSRVNLPSAVSVSAISETMSK